MDNKDQITGKVEEAIGDLTDDKDLKSHGQIDSASGKLKELAGKIEDKVEHVIDTVKDKLHHD